MTSHVGPVSIRSAPAGTAQHSLVAVCETVTTFSQLICVSGNNVSRLFFCSWSQISPLSTVFGALQMWLINKQTNKQKQVTLN